MPLLEDDNYDLATPAGQQDALQDILDEHNSQFDQLYGLDQFPVYAYQELTVTLHNGDPSGTYSTSLQHGLGFPPVVIVFLKDIANGGYFAMPYVQNVAQINSGVSYIDSYWYFTVDNQKLYFNVYATNEGGVFNETTITAGFYIFNLPAQVS